MTEWNGKCNVIHPHNEASNGQESYCVLLAQVEGKAMPIVDWNQQ